MKSVLKHREFQLLAAIVALALIIAARFPIFIEPSSLGNVYNDTSILIILALGQMAVILTKCVDLSTAATLALCGMVAAILNNLYPDIPVIFLVLIAIALGAVFGAINGLLVWKLDMPPIVVTLGTMTVFRGVFAVGGNSNAAVYAGIDPGRTRFIAFVISGALSGLAGYLWIARYAVAYVDIALGFELDVVAACVIGGVSIAGGIGSVPGAVLGALFLGIIKNALPVINVSPFWQLAISGTVIIIAVAFNARAERKKGRVILKKAEVIA
jgi:rhamnose transport system permease protein